MSYRFHHAVYIGRFQPIHRAHLESIELGLEKAEKLIVFVGSSNRSETVKNPWTFAERRKYVQDAIREHFREEPVQGWSDKSSPSILDRVIVLPLRDYIYNDYKWVSEVYARATSEGADRSKKTLLLGCEKDDSSYYLKMFPTWEFEAIPYLYNLDSTDIRTRMYENGKVEEEMIESSTERFINDWIASTKSKGIREEYFYYRDYLKDWESAPYTPIFTTVDALVIKAGCLLLIKRGFYPGKGRWALPGGFLDPNEHIIDAMVRELKEETRIKVPKHTLRGAVKDIRVFDHPKRSMRGRIITHAHLVDLGIGHLPDIKAASDASGAHWVPLADIMKMEELFFEDHFDIIVNMVSKY